MLYYFFLWLSHYAHAFQLVHYVSVRAILACATALIVGLCLGPVMIRFLQTLQIGQVVRQEGPASHYAKSGTPTMGGSLILMAIAIAVFAWADLSNRYIWLTLLVTFAFGLIGFYDDFLKLVRKNPKGLPGRFKLISQGIISIAVLVYLYVHATSVEQTALLLPFTNNMMLPLGGFFILLGFFVIVGSSNAVNLTDGLDGLAILPVILVAVGLGIFAYLTGNMKTAMYLHIPFIAGTSELCIFCAALIGAGLSFLWFNAYPAQIFMGDVGALSLGGALGIVAVIIRQEIVFFIMGGIFVLEAVSVILQVGSYKLRKKRIFKMAPIHHHFELKGWPEPKVIVRFWIITFLLVLVGLATLKIR